MSNSFAKIAFTDSVKEVQSLMGSRRHYARLESGAERNRLLSDNEVAFIEARDSFYLSTVGETGWPYIQHRGGPKGFLKVLPENEIGFADFSGNRQYVSVGNLTLNDKVALILVDYPTQTRLKLLGTARIIDTTSELMRELVPANNSTKVERGIIIQVHGFDWNCPQHITPRWTAEEIADAMVPLREKIKALEAALAKVSSTS